MTRQRLGSSQPAHRKAEHDVSAPHSRSAHFTRGQPGRRTDGAPVFVLPWPVGAGVPDWRLPPEPVGDGVAEPELPLPEPVGDGVAEPEREPVGDGVGEPDPRLPEPVGDGVGEPDPWLPEPVGVGVGEPDPRLPAPVGVGVGDCARAGRQPRPWDERRAAANAAQPPLLS
jgi:hypothetical protein